MTPLESTLPLAQPPEIVHGAIRTIQRPGVQRFRFDDVWCLHRYDYALRLDLDGVAHRVERGTVSLIPPGMRMVYHIPEAVCPHDYVLFKLQPAEPRHRFRVLQKRETLRVGIGHGFDEFSQALHDTPGRATAVVWHLLWLLRETPSPNPEADDPVETAVRHIRDRLAQPLRVAELAREVGVSHNHLTRGFRDRFGIGVAAYIRRQRVELATHLLRNTTMPIKAIAVETGLPDPHHFNKTLRKELGVSPTHLRQARLDEDAPRG